MKEHAFNCPYCFNAISTWVETHKVKQQFIEDCACCRNPLEMIVDCSYGIIDKVMVNPIAQ